MSSESTTWRSQTGAENAAAIQVQYGEGFAAIAEFDRIGHLLLFRAGSSGRVDGVERIVGIALLRRAVAMFAGLRALFEHSLIDPSKTIARSYFELWMQYRCLAYGGKKLIALETPTDAAAREPRARRFYVASERRGLRSRALIVAPGSLFQPKDSESREALHNELVGEMDRLRRDYAAEWAYFGEVTEATLVRQVGSRHEPPWFAPDFPSGSVRSVKNLADAFGYGWEYSFLYDIWSAAAHGRGIKQDVTIEDSTLGVRHPHDPAWFQTLAFFALGWHSMLLTTVAKWHVPSMIPQLQELLTKHDSGIEQLRAIDEVPEFLE